MSMDKWQSPHWWNDRSTRMNVIHDWLQHLNLKQAATARCTSNDPAEIANFYNNKLFKPPPDVPNVVLSEEELLELRDHNATPDGTPFQDQILAGCVDKQDGVLYLKRGSGHLPNDPGVVVVPLSMFTPAGGVSPDFDRFSIEQYGLILKFGEYEATVDRVLYECCQDYRERHPK